LKDVTNCDNCTTLDDDILGDYDIYGCTDPNFVEYNPLANIDDGSCSTPIVYGCTNPLANNYDPNANTDDGSCNYDIYGCTCGGSVVNGAGVINDCYGTGVAASNYDPNATVDDGSCIACVWGCTISTAINYNSGANCDDGSCIIPIPGCTDPLAYNYTSGATQDDGSCLYGGSNCANNSTTVSNGNTYNTYINYDPTAEYDCNSELLGTVGDSSTGPQSANYDSCCTPCVFGCTDATAQNYDPSATCDDG